MSSRGHFSSASGMTVWLVYATVLEVSAHALSQSMPSTSTRMRMSSGAARVGWVSFIWMATFSGRVDQSVLPRSLKRAMISCTEAEQSMTAGRGQRLTPRVPSGVDTARAAGRVVSSWTRSRRR